MKTVEMFAGYATFEGKEKIVHVCDTEEKALAAYFFVNKLWTNRHIEKVTAQVFETGDCIEGDFSLTTQDENGISKVVGTKPVKGTIEVDGCSVCLNTNDGRKVSLNTYAINGASSLVKNIRFI